MGSAQQLLHPLDERAGERAAVFFGRGLERFERFALLGVELLRYFEDEPVARVAGATLAQARHAATPQPQHLLRLAARRDFELVGAVQDGHVEVRAQRELRERDGQIDQEIGAVPREDDVVADTDEHVEVAGRASVDAGAALAGEAQLHAVVDAGRNLDVQHVVAALAPLAATVMTRALVDLPFAAAARTRSGDGQEAMAHADLAAALTGVAGRLLRTGLAAAPAAALAADEPRDLDLRVEPRRGVLERDLQLVLEIFAARGPRPAPAPAAARAGEKVLEDVLEQRAEAALEAAGAGDARRGPEAIVMGALVGIRQDGVRLVDFLEPLLRGLVAGILVRVILHRQLPVGLLELGVACARRDAEHLVVVARRHLGRVLVRRRRHRNHCGAQHAAVQRVAGRCLAHDRVRCGLHAHHARDGFVTGGIERLADGRVAGDADALEHAQQLALNQLHARHDALGAAGGARRRQRAIEVVEDRNQLAQQRLVGVAHAVLGVALGAPPDVVGLGDRAQHAVLLLGKLPLELLDALELFAAAPRRIARGGGFAECGAVVAGVARIVGHGLRTGDRDPDGRARALPSPAGPSRSRST